MTNAMVKTMREILWDKMTSDQWASYASPWRISRDEYDNYSAVIKATRAKKVLLLGVTPELRDLLTSLSKTVVMVDSSLRMKKEMDKLVSQNNFYETFIRSDWHKLDITDEFDLVVGDMILRLIPHSRLPAFFEKISRFLTKDGSFVTRIHIYPNKPHSFIDCLSRFEKLLDEGLSTNTVCDLFIAALFDCFTDTTKKSIMMRDLSHAIDCGLRDKSGNKNLLEMVKKKWIHHSINYTQLAFQELRSLSSKRFKLVNKYVCSEYVDSKLYPIYWFKAKDRRLTE